ncbi:MAG TPA: hypothetical protein VGR96_18970 [Acidobacteriaceae bacterium]|nr:hypothetical protein [Acidobacteriaceae bacterium]
MAHAAQIDLLPATQVAQQTPVQQAANRMCYAMFADTHVSSQELEEIVQAVPEGVAAALTRHAYYFVPLTIGETEETMVAPGYSIALSDRAICHRSVHYEGADCVFISTRLMQDRFALAFEFFINVGHHFVEAAGVPQGFCDLVWSQAMDDVRGETSQEAYESRRRALDRSQSEPPAGRMSERGFARTKEKPTSDGDRKRVDEKAKTSFFEAAFSDALAIYMLSLTLDFNYTDLREREYPLLAPPALAERLRFVAELFPPNPGYIFSIAYRHKTG